MPSQVEGMGTRTAPHRFPREHAYLSAQANHKLPFGDSFSKLPGTEGALSRSQTIPSITTVVLSRTGHGPKLELSQGWAQHCRIPHCSCHFFIYPGDPPPSHSSCETFFSVQPWVQPVLSLRLLPEVIFYQSQQRASDVDRHILA